MQMESPPTAHQPLKSCLLQLQSVLRVSLPLREWTEKAAQALRPEPLGARGLPFRLMEGPIHVSLSSASLLNALHVTGWIALCLEVFSATKTNMPCLSPGADWRLCKPLCEREAGGLQAIQI